MKLVERSFISLLSVCLEQSCLGDDLLQFVVLIYYRKALMEIKVKMSLPVVCYLILDHYRNIQLSLMISEEFIWVCCCCSCVTSNIFFWLFSISGLWLLITSVAIRISLISGPFDRWQLHHKCSRAWSSSIIHIVKIHPCFCLCVTWDYWAQLNTQSSVTFDKKKQICLNKDGPICHAKRNSNH